jgi:hypothetical protein
VGHAGMQTDTRGNPCLAGVLSTVASRPGAAARPIQALDSVATSCVDRRADDSPDTSSLTGRLQELGAQWHARIHPGALPLARASRAPPPPIMEHDFQTRFNCATFNKRTFNPCE